jgi:hypothetical protein
MLFLLATPEYTNVQNNTTKVRVHLRSGIAEIFDQHQDLMGKVENNLVEVESNFENRIEKFTFVLQDAVFIVSNKGLDKNQPSCTGVYIYAKKAFEINSNLNLDELTKQYDEKKFTLDSEMSKLSGKETESGKTALSSKILLIEQEVEFLKQALVIAKKLK